MTTLRQAVATVTDPLHWARYGDYADEEAAALVRAFAAYWPDLESVPAGRDPFLGEPVAGLPDGEQLAALVCDANLTGDE